MSEASFADLNAIESMRNYYGWKADLIRTWLGHRILEVGCGTGLVLDRLPVGAEMVGIDPDSRCIERARQRLDGRSLVELSAEDILDPGALVGRLPFDTALFMNSLEEIRDPALAFERARSVLVPGGRIVVFVSALPGLTGTLDAALAMRRYGRDELGGLLTRAGFIVDRIQYVNLLGALAWWWDSRVMRRTEVSASNYRNRDLLVPLARLFDAITGPPVGRSLLAVGRVRGENDR